MIPKTIHYCWLSKDPLPTETRDCIKSWQKYMPDWRLKLWNMDNFDIHSVPFVEEAVAAKKWAFACDYIRVYALYSEGGIYLDSDVLVRKKMDFVLENRAFSAVEYFPQLAEELIADNRVDSDGNKTNPEDKIHGIQIQAAILGAEKGHPFFKECMDFYHSKHFCVENDGVPKEEHISPIIFASIAEKYGFKYLDIEQDLKDGFKVYPSSMFCSQPYLMRPSAVAVHCCNSSWRIPQSFIGHHLSNAKIYLKYILSKVGLYRDKALERIK